MDEMTFQDIIKAHEEISFLIKSGCWDEVIGSKGCDLDAILAHDHRDFLIKLVSEITLEKDNAYLERNKLVSALSKLFHSGKKKTNIEGWSADWHGCVYIDLPTGQVSWHYHDSQEYLFSHLSEYNSEWDGHSTEIKYERLALLDRLEGK